MSKNIILCGVGGQGTILASRLIATAAMDKNIPIKTAETIGMAQRGGSVFSHLRLGEGTNSPLIGKGEVDLIIGFEPGETVRQLPFLKKGGDSEAASFSEEGRRGGGKLQTGNAGERYDRPVEI